MEITLPELTEWQRDLVKAYDENPTNHWFVTKAIRQVGKSMLIEWLLTYASLKKPNSHSIVVSPTFSQSRKIFTDMSLWARDVLRKCNGATMQITFINGSTVSFNSAEQGDNLRGATVKGTGILCLDEAAFVKNDFFYQILVPMTNVYRSNIFIFSTPKFKQGLFYNLYIKGLSDDSGNVISTDWTTYDTSRFLSPEILELYKQQLPRLAFESEYLGHFIDGDGTVFSDFKKCTGPAVLDPNEELTIGIDWSSGQNQDSTVLSFGQYNFGKIQIEKQIAFNDKNATQTIDSILYELRSYIARGFKQIHLIVEKNSIGQVFFDILSQKVDEFEVRYNESVGFNDEIEVRVSTFNTSNASKQRIIKNLIILFENNNIVIPNDEKLVQELSVFECKISQSGNPIYGAPPLFHDDRVMSLCIAVGQLYNEVEI